MSKIQGLYNLIFFRKPMISAIAPAKLNLFLHVTDYIQDIGYHKIQSVFVKLPGLHDIITVCESDKWHCEIIYNNSNLKIEHIISDNNIALKAAKILAMTTMAKSYAKISIVKNIPIAAGLGGGSSDAAITLKLLSILWKKSLSYDDLFAIASKLGSDVIFSLHPEKCCIISGIGNVIQKLNLHTKFFLVLINPLIQVQSKSVFQAMNPLDFSKTIQENDLSAFQKYVFQGNNDLYKASARLNPVIKQVLESLLLQKNCLFARMTGSGPTCFGAFKDRISAVTALNKIKAQNPLWWYHYEELKV